MQELSSETSKPLEELCVFPLQGRVSVLKHHLKHHLLQNSMLCEWNFSRCTAASGVELAPLHLSDKSEVTEEAVVVSYITGPIDMIVSYLRTAVETQTTSTSCDLKGNTGVFTPGPYNYKMIISSV